MLNSIYGNLLITLEELELFKHIDNSSVETIEKDFHVKYITYENPK